MYILPVFNYKVRISTPSSVIRIVCSTCDNIFVKIKRENNRFSGEFFVTFKLFVSKVGIDVKTIFRKIFCAKLNLLVSTIVCFRSTTISNRLNYCTEDWSSGIPTIPYLPDQGYGFFLSYTAPKQSVTKVTKNRNKISTVSSTVLVHPYFDQQQKRLKISWHSLSLLI